jgi:hypothetical protein
MDSEPVVNIDRQVKYRRGKVVVNKATKTLQKRVRSEQSENCSTSACAVNWKPATGKTNS